MKTLTVNTQKPYSLYIGQEFLLSPAVYEILNHSNTFFIVCDKLLEKNYGKPLYDFLNEKNHTVHLLAIEASETIKTREYKQFIEDYMLQSHCQRDTTAIALGGGMICDLVGFTAASYYRGIPVVYMPSTLLAMIDASIGGKTAVNTAWGKNLIGCFKQPQAVIMDIKLLQSLPYIEIKEALAEIIKHACIADADLFEALLHDKDKLLKLEPDYLQMLIEKNCAIKKSFVEKDEFDQHARRALNAGHTIGHALEAASQYNVRHGEGVALGLLAEVFLAETLKIAEAGCLEKIKNILQHYDLLAFSKLEKIPKDAIVQALSFDKKNEHKVFKLPLIKKIGELAYYDYSLDLNQLNKAIDFLYE